MPTTLYLLQYEYVPDVMERRDPFRPGHLETIQRWFDAGKLVIAGGVGDPLDRGMLALRIDDPSEVQAFIDEDPYHDAGLIKSWRVDPWTVVAGA